MRGTAAAIYLGGAIGCEMLGGYLLESYGLTLPYKASSMIEESLEMAGAVVFIWAVLDYIGAEFGEIRFELRRTGDRA